jgi:hypothetical protein
MVAEAGGFRRLIKEAPTNPEFGEYDHREHELYVNFSVWRLQRAILKRNQKWLPIDKINGG